VFVPPVVVGTELADPVALFVAGGRLVRAGEQVRSAACGRGDKDRREGDERCLDPPDEAPPTAGASATTARRASTPLRQRLCVDDVVLARHRT